MMKILLQMLMQFITERYDRPFELAIACAAALLLLAVACGILIWAF